MNAADFGKDKTLISLLQALESGIAVFSADGKLLFVNDAMRRITGTHPDTDATLSTRALGHQLFREDGTMVPLEEFPVMKAFNGHDTDDEIYAYIDKDGMRRWLTVSSKGIRNEQGTLEYVMTAIRDISRRKFREDKLRFMVESAKILTITADYRERLTQKARLAVPSLADWCAIDILKQDGNLERVVVVHRDPEKIKFVESVAQKFPRDRSATSGVYKVLRTGEAEFVPHFGPEMAAAALAQVPEEKRAMAQEVLDTLGITSYMTIPIPSRGKILGAMTLAYAESGRKYTKDDLQFFTEFCLHLGVLIDSVHLFEEIRSRDKAKDLFLATLSHELRNPLAPIKSSIELLKFKGVPDDIREELGTIEHQFDHMAKLLNDLLDTTRFTQAKIEITPQSLELQRLVERALKASEALIRNADITLHFTHTGSAIEVFADDTRLEQAVTNLMNNAIKFTAAGGDIWVELSRHDGNAIIKIRDNGAGIDPQELPNIFEMYYQSERSRSANTGLGIGLLLVQKIVHLHGGTIEAKSEGIGHGSEFIITLPLSYATAPTEATPAEDGGPRGKHILIVDDNIQAADALVKLFNKLGGYAEARYSGEETIAHTDIEKFDVILLDIGMPRMDGYEVVKTLRERGLTRPIVALTGYGLIEDKQKASSAGFDAHLTKPIGIKELRELFASLFPVA